MKIVVDSNILFTFFWKRSVAKELFSNSDAGWYSPDFAISEIKKYSREIIQKTGISASEFEALLSDLAGIVQFVPLSSYSSFLKKAAAITPDEDDVDFVALALYLECPVWSNDKQLLEIKEVKVLSTEHILNFF